MTWQQRRDAGVLERARPHLDLLERHGWRYVSLHWWRLRGHQLLLARPNGATEYYGAEELPRLAAWVAEGGGA